jgi:hypothetical protein
MGGVGSGGLRNMHRINGRFTANPNSGPIAKYRNRKGPESGFKTIQRRALLELKRRTRSAELKKMELDDIAKVLKTCREHLAMIHQTQLTHAGGNKIEFVIKTPLEKAEKKKDDDETLN